MNNNGRIEKSVNAHQGACLAAQWSPDGAGLLTGLNLLLNNSIYLF